MNTKQKSLLLNLIEYYAAAITVADAEDLVGNEKNADEYLAKARRIKARIENLLDSLGSTDIS